MWQHPGNSFWSSSLQVSWLTAGQATLSSTHFVGLFDKLFHWLSGWKSKLLSLGGRFQLIRSSIHSYLSYWFRSVVFPKGILKRLNSLVARFFYHGSDTKKMHTISWHKTTLPRAFGGTGLSSIHTLYHICKSKLFLKVIKPGSLLGNWCKARYTSIWKQHPPQIFPCLERPETHLRLY